jgi:hypothetical protein
VGGGKRWSRAGEKMTLSNKNHLEFLGAKSKENRKKGNRNDGSGETDDLLTTDYTDKGDDLFDSLVFLQKNI